MVATDPISDARVQLKALSTRKTTLEAEIDCISARLCSGPNAPGLQGNLVDKEGYPRSDVDIPAVRADRQRLIMLTNDHKALMQELDKALISLHAAVREAQQTDAPGAPPPLGSAHAAVAGLGDLSHSHQGVPGSGCTPGQQQPSCSHPPFATVDEVTDGSPAQAAGVRVGDLLCEFGGITRDAGAAVLARVAQVLAASEGRPLAAVVLRSGTHVQLQLTPQRWPGRGLLGCHLQPL